MRACPARAVAALYNVTVTAIQELIPLVQNSLHNEFPDNELVVGCLEHAMSQTSGFCAIAVVIENYQMVLYNSSCSPARQESDIMHELSHIIRGHKGDSLQINAEIATRQYDSQCEAEAKWLGASIQIPEAGIMQLAKRGASTEQIAQLFGASLEMVTYRRNILAVDRRLSYFKK